MGEGATIPRKPADVPIETLAVEVIEGPDAGLRHTADEDLLTVGTARGNQLLLADPTVSRFHLELTRGQGGILIVDLGSTNGTLAGGVRVERGTAPPGTLVRLGDTVLRLAEGKPAVAPALSGDLPGRLVGTSAAMRRLLAQVELAAGSNIAVLLLGESGTGKEVLARTLHDLGPRADRPFVTVDCGALAPTLVASELFGHERGAFTGADRQRVGAFEAADGGTLFLDEVGELPAALQAALLGALERRRIRRLGGERDIAVDVRLVCATNRDLRMEVNANRFRLDLYFRLAALVLRAPPLRERPEDIPLLIEHFLREADYDGSLDRILSPATLESLVNHHWPGNVRELRNLIEASLAVGDGLLLEPDADARAAGDPAPVGRVFRHARAAAIRQFERRFFGELIARTGGNVARAAREAEMDRSYLLQILKRHGLR